MSHNYLQDQAMLKKLLTLPLTYLGFSGHTKETRKLFAELEKRNFPTNQKLIFTGRSRFGWRLPAGHCFIDNRRDT